MKTQSLSSKGKCGEKMQEVVKDDVKRQSMQSSGTVDGAGSKFETRFLDQEWF